MRIFRARANYIRMRAMNYNNQSGKYLSMLRSVLLLCIILAISACSPHPGAGTWKADGDNSLKISSIKIIFEGTADFFSSKNESENKSKDEEENINTIYRCFWSASGENQMQMQCIHSDDIEKKETFHFTIIETGQGKLSRNEHLIGLFQKLTDTQQ